MKSMTDEEKEHELRRNERNSVKKYIKEKLRGLAVNCKSVIIGDAHLEKKVLEMIEEEITERTDEIMTFFYFKSDERLNRRSEIIIEESEREYIKEILTCLVDDCGDVEDVDGGVEREITGRTNQIVELIKRIIKGDLSIVALSTAGKKGVKAGIAMREWADNIFLIMRTVRELVEMWEEDNRIVEFVNKIKGFQKLMKK